MAGGQREGLQDQVANPELPNAHDDQPAIRHARNLAQRPGKRREMGGCDPAVGEADTRRKYQAVRRCASDV